MDSPAKCEKREVDQAFVLALISSRRTLEIGVLDLVLGWGMHCRTFAASVWTGIVRAVCGTETIERAGVGSGVLGGVRSCPESIGGSGVGDSGADARRFGEIDRVGPGLFSLGWKRAIRTPQVQPPTLTQR